MKKVTVLTAIIALAIAAILTPSCSKSNSGPASTPTSTLTLYDSLGGTTLVNDPANPGTQIETGRLGIRSVIDSTIFVIAADPQINSYFSVLLAEVAAGNLSGYTALSNNLTDFVCVATGATDFTYGGKSMMDAHNPNTNSRISGLVTSAAFTEFLNDVVAGANQNNLPSYLTARLGALLETLMGQVVQS